ncbi:MAG: FAD-binding protein [Chloroflexi bacterium]|nr:FAD-binding protein [Chloroflexota bacterium]
MVKDSGVHRHWDMEVDLVAVGASSGGLAAVILGHDLGLTTVLLEKSEFLGGGTALSGGLLWVPFNPVMLGKGLSDSEEEAAGHIRRVGMGCHDEQLMAAYLKAGPEAIRYLEARTPLRLTTGLLQGPDYYADLPGGKSLGRQLYADPDVMIPRLREAEKKYPLMAQVRSDPIPYLGGVRDPWSEGRGLIGGLVLACAERGINILTKVRGKRLIAEKGRVIGLHAEKDGSDFFVRAKKGVLLACGGFEHNAEMNKRFINMPDLKAYTPISNEGDGHIMGMEFGAAIALMDHSIYQPVLRIEGEMVDGRQFHRPVAYGYPGNILVNRHGKRFCNESFYPDIGRAFMARDKVNSELVNPPIYWISDQTCARRVGTLGLAKFAKSKNWLHESNTLAGLAGQLGIPSQTLEETVSRFNSYARGGRDPDFHRGETTYQKWWGSRIFPEHQPNPALGPVETSPFYGMKLDFGTVGNLGGLVTNAHAQVIDVRGEVIPGLYGTSNTTALLTHGLMYTSGACQAKSLIFGYIAARHMARERD